MDLDERRLAAARALMDQDRAREAIPLYEKLADAGCAEAAMALARIYATGIAGGFLDKLLGNLRPDAEKAEIYYRLAADLGHQAAQVGMARGYFEGKEAAQDFRQAFLCLCRAVDNPDMSEQFPYALSLLGELYAKGLGCERNLPHGVLLRCAATEMRDRLDARGYRPLPVLRPRMFEMPQELEAWGSHIAREWLDGPLVPISMPESKWLRTMPSPPDGM